MLSVFLQRPKFNQIVVGEDGFPAAMVVPDPRAFTIHKLWLRRQTDRKPIKKKRDYSKALAVCHLILRYLPDFNFKPQELKMFSKVVVSEAAKAFDSRDLPPGYVASLLDQRTSGNKAT
jgi:hypothetical protein